MTNLYDCIVIENITLAPDERKKFSYAGRHINYLTGNYVILCENILKPNQTTSRRYRLIKKTALEVSYTRRKNELSIKNITNKTLHIRQLNIQYVKKEIYR